MFSSENWEKVFSLKIIKRAVVCTTRFLLFFFPKKLFLYSDSPAAFPVISAGSVYKIHSFEYQSTFFVITIRMITTANNPMLPIKRAKSSACKVPNRKT